jgi:hypothetical protein
LKKISFDTLYLRSWLAGSLDFKKDSVGESGPSIRNLVWHSNRIVEGGFEK